ncbi:MAG: helix-turn-helix transcriptional regulator, partial [Candidatus Cloacimonetes bacterium]|nr:helix-turn-helix transcriptional regulator [Candidatus Cloacimonadota bacterium]
NSIAQVTMRDIARQSEYTISTIYKYFNSKEELLFELLTALMEGKSTWLFSVIDQVQEPLAKIYCYLQANFHWLKRFPAELKLSHYVNSSEFKAENISDLARHLQKGRRYKLYQYFEKIFQDGRETGYFETDFDIPMTQDLMTITFKQVYYSIIILDHRNYDYFREYARLFLRSLVTPQKRGDIDQLITTEFELPLLPEEILFDLNQSDQLETEDTQPETDKKL